MEWKPTDGISPQKTIFDLDTEEYPIFQQNHDVHIPQIVVSSPKLTQSRSTPLADDAATTCLPSEPVDEAPTLEQGSMAYDVEWGDILSQGNSIDDPVPTSASASTTGSPSQYALSDGEPDNYKLEASNVRSYGGLSPKMSSHQRRKHLRSHSAPDLSSNAVSSRRRSGSDATGQSPMRLNITTHHRRSRSMGEATFNTPGGRSGAFQIRTNVIGGLRGDVHRNTPGPRRGSFQGADSETATAPADFSAFVNDITDDEGMVTFGTEPHPDFAEEFVELKEEASDVVSPSADWQSQAGRRLDSSDEPRSPGHFSDMGETLGLKTASTELQVPSKTPDAAHSHQILGTTSIKQKSLLCTLCVETVWLREEDEWYSQCCPPLVSSRTYKGHQWTLAEDDDTNSRYECGSSCGAITDLSTRFPNPSCPGRSR